jgi:hypothetical protein
VSVPRLLRLGLLAGIGTLLLAASAVWILRGPAILLDLAAGSARLFCL